MVEFKKIELDSDRILGIQKNNVYRIVVKQTGELKGARFIYGSKCNVVSYDNSGHKRALSKFKRPNEWTGVYNPSSTYIINAEIQASGKPLDTCTVCGVGTKHDSHCDKPIQFLTPTGNRNFYFSREQDILLAFLLRCRPSKHGCNSFTLKLEIINSEDPSNILSADIYLETRKRDRRDSITDIDIRRSSVDYSDRRSSVDLSPPNMPGKRYSVDISEDIPSLPHGSPNTQAFELKEQMIDESQTRPTKQFKLTRALPCPTTNANGTPKYIFYSEPFAAEPLDPSSLPSVEMQDPIKMSLSFWIPREEKFVKSNIFREVNMFLPPSLARSILIHK